MHRLSQLSLAVQTCAYVDVCSRPAPDIDCAVFGCEVVAGWDLVGSAAAFLWLLWHHVLRFACMLNDQLQQQQQQPLIGQPDEQQQLDMDATPGGPNTRICVSVEQMAPLLEKLYTDLDTVDEDARLAAAVDDRIATSDVSWNEAVVAGLKESQAIVYDLMHGRPADADVPAVDEGSNGHGPPGRRDFDEERHAVTVPQPDSEDERNNNGGDGDKATQAYVNYVDLSEVNPIIEANMCFQSDELFEGKANVIANSSAVVVPVSNLQ